MIYDTTVGFKPGDNDTGEDKINLTIGVSDDTTKVIVTLVAGEKIIWWKGIVQGQWEMLSTQDDRKGPNSGHYSITDLENAWL